MSALSVISKYKGGSLLKKPWMKERNTRFCDDNVVYAAQNQRDYAETWENTLQQKQQSTKLESIYAKLKYFRRSISDVHTVLKPT